MTKLTLEYKRLSPNESLAKIKDTTNNTKFWRHRYCIKYRSQIDQLHKDYPIKKFESFKKFCDYVEELTKQKYQIL